MAPTSQPDLLRGKAVVVTGAGQGLGRAFAIDAASHGAAVVVNDIDRNLADEVAASIGGAGGVATASGHSVSVWHHAEALIAQCVEDHGKIDALVNNAGYFYLANSWEDTEEELRTTIETNVLGSAFCGSHAIKRFQAQRSGSIVNVTSGGQSGEKQEAGYCASKGAIASLTYSWALELDEHGVRVNAVAPTANTRILEKTRRFRPSTVDWPPEQMAPLVTFLLSDLAGGITGQVIRLWDRELAVMTHPKIHEPSFDAEVPWTIEALDAIFKGAGAAALQPVGLRGQLRAARAAPSEVGP